MIPRQLRFLLSAGLLAVLASCSGSGDEDSLRLYVARFELPYGTSWLYTYSVPQLQLKGKMKVNNMAARLAVTPALDQIWLSGETSRSVMRFDTLGDSILGSVPAGGAASAGSFSPDGAYFLFAGNAVMTKRLKSNVVNLVDVARLDLIAQLEVGDDPRATCFSPDGRHAFVANTGDASISRIDLSEPAAARVDSTLSTAAGPVHLICDPLGRWLYVACLGEQREEGGRAPGELRIYALPSLRQVAVLEAGRHPSRICCVSDGTLITVSEMRGSRETAPCLRVYRVEGEIEPHLTLLHELDIGPNSLAGDISPDGRWFAAPDFDTSTLTLVDLKKGMVERSITLPDAGRPVHSVDALFGRHGR